MIVYFADRRLSILGLASTELNTSAHITDDTTVTDVDTGTTTLSLVLEYDDAGRKAAENMANAGNYILRHTGTKDEFFTIIDFEEDVDSHQISIYAEDGGLDLINDVAGPFISESAHTLQWYMERWLNGTGFEVRIQSFTEQQKTLQLGWDNTTTVTNRLVSIADAFEAEIDFGFTIDGLKLTNKYVNVYKKIGKDIQSKLRVGKELSNLRIKKTVANLATALDVVGGADNSEVDMTNVGAILIGNDYAFGETDNRGWVDSFYQRTECMGYAIRQPGGDFAAKGNSSSTYPNKNYAECLASFMSTSGSQNKSSSVSGERGYSLSVDLSWTIPTGTNPFSVSYTVKLHSGPTYYFTNFLVGWSVSIGGNVVDSQARSSSSWISMSTSSTITLCTGTASVNQTDSATPVTVLLDMNPYTVDGRAVGPSGMKIEDSFKVVRADTDEQKKTIRYIIVGGGINDFSATRNSGGVDAIKRGIDDFITEAHRSFPYARIYFIPLYSTIEGNILDQSKPVKTVVSRPSFSENDWLECTILGATNEWNNTSSSRGGAVNGDIFHVKGRSTDGGWTHTAVYQCTNDSGNLIGTCVGHFVDGLDDIRDTWVSYARTKGVYTCEKSFDWFKGDYNSRPETGSSMLLNSSGYSTAGDYIEQFIGGWDGDIESAGNGYMSTRYVTLEGMEYDDGDFYVDGPLLKSRKAVSKWTRFVNNDTAYSDSYHIVKSFSYDTDNKDELLTRAITELTRLREAEVTYEADINYLPANIGIGDVVDIVDEYGELFLSTRILQIEHSAIKEEDRIVFGDFTVKDSGISQIVYNLANQFKEEASKQNFYTWTAYADDNMGTNISLSRLPSSMYLGIATYRISPEVDLSDPGVFKWTILEDSDSITINIASSNGTYFTDTTVNTVLTAYVFVNGVQQTPEQISQYGLIHWYKDGALITETTQGGTRPYEGNTLTILEADLVDKGVYEARLEG